MINALDRYLINGVNTNKEFLSNILQHKNFISGDISTKFIEENYSNGFDPVNTRMQKYDEIFAVALFIHFKYMNRAASISNQVKGFNRMIDSEWNIISKNKKSKAKITFNNYNQNYDIFIDKKYFNLKSDWKIGFPLLSALIENKLLYFGITRNGPKYTISHKSLKIEIIVLSDRHTELNSLMIPRKKIDTSKFLLSPMPGLLVSIFVKKGQKVQEGESIAVIEAMKMENIIKAEKELIIKDIFSQEGDSLLVDQSIMEFE